MSERVIAIIPARGGSKGIPRKNLQELAGKPLLAHTVEQALACPRIDRVIVNSEDAEICTVAAAYGAEVLDRPEEFYHDNSVQEVDRLLIWCVKKLEEQDDRPDVIVLLYPTSPLRQVKSVEAAIRMVTEDGYDSVLSLHADSTYLWKTNQDNTVSPVNYDPRRRGPRQKEAWNQWAENKSIYVVKSALLINSGCRLGGRVGYLEVDKLDSIDIDTPADLDLARCVMEQRLRASKPTSPQPS